MLSISPGHSAKYLTGQVAKGRESYYLNATTAGEPPGRWWGAGAAKLGLSGEVDHAEMEALYGQNLDPRDPRWADLETRSECARLGRAPGRYRSAEETLSDRIATTYRIDGARVTELIDSARRPGGDGLNGAKFDRLAAELTGALPEQIREMRTAAERTERQAQSFLDATFSPAKSVTVLHTALARAELDAQRAGREQEAARWAGRRAEVERAVWAGNNAMLRTLSERAGYARIGRHGAGADRWMVARDWTVASFHQSDSRDHDPQQHIHNAIHNRVVCPDGVVRALDGKSIYAWRQAAGAVGERVMEEHLSASSMAIRWTLSADGNSREIEGVDQAAMALFSSRSSKISKSLQVKVDAFRERFEREPSAIEMDRLKRQSTMATRVAKAHTAETEGERLDRWEGELRTEVAGGLHRIADRITGQAERAGPVQAEPFSASGLVAEAIAACQGKRSTIDRSALERQIILRLPHLGGADEGRVTRLVRGLADYAEQQLVAVDGQQSGGALPAELRRADGQSVYANPAGRRFATPDHVMSEQALRRAAVARGRRAVDPAAAERWLRGPGASLGEDQRAAVKGLLTGGAQLSVVVGRAGTGKSYALGAYATAWRELTGGRVVGVATSEAAAKVLQDDGMTAVNTRAWLQAQKRLAAGSRFPADLRLAIGPDDVVVVDESSMADAADVADIRQFAERAGGGVVLTGDPRQLGAIGAGGSMQLVTDVADTFHLTEVRRFDQAWERRASLGLRDGDPDVIAEYDRHGRVLDEGTVEHAIHAAGRAYLGDVLAGKRSMVFAATNALAGHAAATIRDMRIELGQVEPDGITLGCPGDGRGEGNTCGVGDLIQARKIDRSIGVINRDRFAVREIRADGSMLATREADGAELELPAAYVAEHVALGYAGTVHCAQGATITTGHAVVTPGMSLEALYVALSRGTEANTAHVATHPVVRGDNTGEVHGQRVAATTILERIMEQEVDDNRAALTQLADDVARAGSLRTLHALIEDGVREVTRQRLDTQLDRLAADGVLSDADRRALASDQGTEQLSRLLRAAEQAGHDPDAVLRTAIEGRPLTGLRSVPLGIQGRIMTALKGDLAPAAALGEPISVSGVNDQWQEYLGRLAEEAADRQRALGAEVAAEPPQWAVESLGPVPDDVVARAEWEHRAATVAAYREASAWDHEAEPVGPSPGLYATEKRAGWHAAWEALGRPEVTPEEQQLSEGALRCRVRAAQREAQWAPPYVPDEQRATAQAIARHQQDAAHLRAQAEAAADQAEAERLRAEADDRQAAAEVMVTIESRLEAAAEQRAAWLLETAQTRDLGRRAELELETRGRPIDAEADRMTADEWLAEHDRAMREEDPHREITETDVVDIAEPEREAADVWGQTAGDVDDAAERDREDGWDWRETAAAGVPATESAAVATAEDGDALTLPKDVPALAETEAAAVAARLAADEMADRTSAEEAWRASQGAEDQAAREQAWRDQDAADAQAAAVHEDEDALSM